MVAQFCEYAKNHQAVCFNERILWYVNYASLKLF